LTYPAKGYIIYVSSNRARKENKMATLLENLFFDSKPGKKLDGTHVPILNGAIVVGTYPRRDEKGSKDVILLKTTGNQHIAAQASNITLRTEKPAPKRPTKKE
jgi:hypothetical protein